MMGQKGKYLGERWRRVVLGAIGRVWGGTKGRETQKKGWILYFAKIRGTGPVHGFAEKGRNCRWDLLKDKTGRRWGKKGVERIRSDWNNLQEQASGLLLWKGQCD